MVRSAEQTVAIWRRLLTGAPLDDLGLGLVDGRVDLRGLAAPEPSVVRTMTTPLGQLAQLGNLVVVRGVRWKGLDMSRGRLASLRFEDATIEDCRFDGASCREWRMWETTIAHTTFHGASLRGAALGGISEDGRRNAFRRVDFSESDLRQTAYDSCEFVECRFVNANVKKVEFMGSVFVDCTFEGDLEETAFARHGLSGSRFPPNEMKGVDFRRAKLRSVALRWMDLTDVRWPEDDEHIVIRDYVATLDRVLSILQPRQDIPSRQIAAYLQAMRQWAGPRQMTGVIHRGELAQFVGDAAVEELERMIGEGRHAR